MYLVAFKEGIPTVVDTLGVLVPGAHVLRVRFPKKEIHTSEGKIHIINGAGVADIIVSGTPYGGIAIR